MRYVPFERNIFPGLTVAENLRATRARTGHNHDVDQFPELARLADRPAGVLSGGERQLLAIACALQGSGRVLLLDEPTHALAPEAAARVIETLAEAAHTQDRAILVAEPSTSREALRAHADFIWPLERGHRLPAMGG